MTHSGDRGMDRLARTVTEIEAGLPVVYLAPRCAACGWEDRIRTGHAHLPVVKLEQILRRRGWLIGRKLTCPQCLAQPKAQPKPEIPMAVTQDVAGQAMTSAALSPNILAADPPRIPTREQRRAVGEGLYDHYLVEKDCYREGFSDKTLAAKLAVPARWVADIREALGFGPDCNEAGAIFTAELASIAKEIAQISDDVLGRIEGVEKRLKRLEIDRAYQPA